MFNSAALTILVPLSVFAAWVSLLTQLGLGVMFQGQVGLNFYGAPSSDSQNILLSGNASDFFLQHTET